MANQFKYNPITGKLDMIGGGGGSEFDPNGIYPGLTAGGLMARQEDAIIDLRTSFIFRSSGGTESISTGAAKISQLYGNVVNGKPFNASAFKSIGFNAFNPGNVLNKAIQEDGTIEDSTEHKMAYVHVIAGQVGSGRNNGYIISSKESALLLVNRVAFVASDPTEATSATVLSATAISTTRSAYIPPTDGWLLIDCYNAQLADMCVHLAWSYDPQNWLEYSESVVNLPIVHEWGMGKAGSVMDEIDFLNQTTTIRVDRALLGSLKWNERKIDGDKAYSDSSLTTEAGIIEAVTENSITVGEFTYRRDPDYDTEEAFAWERNEMFVFTANDTPTSTSYSYSTEDLKTQIKASTANISAYGLPSSYSFVVESNGTVVLRTGSRITPSTDLAGIYAYYELAQEIRREETTEAIYHVDDFGTEEFVGTETAPTYATFFYLPNLYDSIRQTINNDSNMRSYTVPFGTTSVMGQDVNVEAPLVITKIVAFNVASLRVTTGDYVQTPISLTNGHATVQIPVAIDALITWEITRINANQNASIGVRYEY